MIPYDKIREHYKHLTPYILEISEGRAANWVTPYTDLVDWLKIFTPIEFDAWQAIRCNGKCPLYPQYPVSNYFLDFGNPYLKIGVECDGAEFHLDKKKDNDRDYELKLLGWKIYRISGSDCWKRPSNYFYDLQYQPEENRWEILSEYYENTLEGLINALAIIHCNYKWYYNDEWVNEKGLAHKCLQDRLSKPVKNWTNTNKPTSNG